MFISPRSRECCRITRTRLEVCIAGGKAKGAYEYPPYPVGELLSFPPGARPMMWGRQIGRAGNVKVRDLPSCGQFAGREERM